MKNPIRLRVWLMLWGCPFITRCQNPAPAEGELGGHQFVVTSMRTGNTDVFTVDPTTGDARNLTRHPAEDRYPMWSPDGRKIVFTSNRNGAHNLFVMGADGSSVRQLTRETAPAYCYFPTWPGKGGWIVFGLDRGGKGMVARVAPNGSGFEVIGDGRDPCVSPDGEKIAFTGGVGKGSCVFVMDADGKNVRQLTTHENEIGAVGPTWSPDGTRILYCDQMGTTLELFVCDADGKNQKQLTYQGMFIFSPAWSPDGKWISYRMTDDPRWRDAAWNPGTYEGQSGDRQPVYVVLADGSNPHAVEALRYQAGVDGSRAAWKPK